jgi:uncharacterized protein (TIGR02001 family)
LVGFGLLTFFAACGNAQAQELTTYAALTSDYVNRGVSNSDGHAAAQLGFDVSTEVGLFVGVWASTTDITTGGRHRPREVNYYIGYSQHFDNDWSTSVSINRYAYPGATGDVDYDYTELATVISVNNRLWFEVNYTDSFYGHGESAYNLEVLASWPLPASLSLAAGIGYFDVSNLAGSAYTYWQIGVSRPLGWVTADLRYHDTSNVPPLIGSTDLADARLVLTFSVVF